MARSIQAHEGPVWAMSLYGKTLVTVSQDKTVSLLLNLGDNFYSLEIQQKFYYNCTCTMYHLLLLL